MKIWNGVKSHRIGLSTLSLILVHTHVSYAGFIRDILFKNPLRTEIEMVDLKSPKKLTDLFEQEESSRNRFSPGEEFMGGERQSGGELGSPQVETRQRVVEEDPDLGVNIIPQNTYLLAVASDELSHEYRLMAMSESELKKTQEYELYKDSQNQFMLGIDNLVHFRAEIFCKQKGYALARGFELGYLKKDRFVENQLFQMGWYDEIASVSSLPRSAWSFSRHGKAFEKKMRKQGYQECPHLVFRKLKCSGEFQNPEEDASAAVLSIQKSSESSSR